jgi:serine/threonine-protein kinase
MAAIAADRNLLFGLLALQNGLINQGQLVAAFQAWSLDKAQALADYLVARRDLDAAQRAAIEALAALHIEKHGGHAEKSLAAIPAGRSTRESLARIGDPDLGGTLAHVGSASARPDDDAGADRTATYSVGTATSDGQRFRVLRPHARGGLGAVFVALDEELHREVALKQILDHHADDPASRQRFLVEAEITGGLEHPGIVPVYGLGTYGDGRPFYAMRFIRGDSLKEAIERFHTDPAMKTNAGRRSLELRKLLRRFLDVCNAIGYAHSRGVLHRDIKPGNVIVGRHGETLVVDWGLAKAQGRADVAESPDERPLMPSSASGSAETLPGSALGTPAYMSPEQARGDLEQLGPRSDVYSLGATLYCLLTGRPPAEDDDVGAVLRAVQRGEFPPPRQVDPAIDRALEAVCLKAMAHKAEDRYSSCKALAEDIERWSADEPVSAYRDPVSDCLARWGRRHRTAAASLAVLLLTAVAGLSVGTILISRERAKAESSFRQARQAVDDYFTTISESKLLNVPGLQPLRKELLERARRYYQGFLQQRGSDAAVRAETAATYYRLADITGQISNKEDAIAQYSQALIAYEGLVRDRPEVLQYQVDLAMVCNNLGVLHRRSGHTAEARRIQEKALAIRERLARTNPEGGRFQNELAKSYGNLGSVYFASGDQSRALEYYKRARTINEDLVRHPEPSVALPTALGQRYNSARTFKLDLAGDLYWIGFLQFRLGLGSMDDAIRAIDEALAVSESVPADGQSDTEAMTAVINAREDAGFFRVIAGRLDEAGPYLEGAYKKSKDLARSNPAVDAVQSQLAAVTNDLGHWMREKGRLDEAMTFQREALEIQEPLVEANPGVDSYRWTLAYIHRELGWIHRLRGRREDAVRSFSLASDIDSKLPESYSLRYCELPRDRALLMPLMGRGVADESLTPDELFERQTLADEAMKALKKAVETGFRNTAFLSRCRDFDPLRTREDFRSLVASLVGEAH